MPIGKDKEVKLRKLELENLVFMMSVYVKLFKQKVKTNYTRVWTETGTKNLTQQLFQGRKERHPPCQVRIDDELLT